MQITIPGQYYSANKAKFKRILKSHDLVWKGNWAHNVYVWKNEDNKVNADFIREDDITTEVILKIDGSEELIQEIQDWAGDSIVSEEDVQDDRIQKLKAFWDERIRQEKAKGAPSGWIVQMEKQRDKELST